MSSTSAATTVRHSELVSLINGGFEGIENYTCPLNPGLSSTFPWLSNMAKNWEMYRFLKLQFEFRPRTGTTTPGSVVHYIDYDAKDAPPDSYTQAVQMGGAVSGTPYTRTTMTGNPASMQRAARGKKYVRQLGEEVEGDITLYDAGNHQLVTTGAAAAGQSWGELWVHYACEFFNPSTITTALKLFKGARTVYQALNSTRAFVAGVPTKVLPPDLAPTIDEIGLGPLDPDSIITVQKDGKYLIRCNCAQAMDSNGAEFFNVLQEGPNIISSSRTTSVDDFGPTTVWGDVSMEATRDLLAGDTFFWAGTNSDIGTAGSDSGDFQNAALVLTLLELFSSSQVAAVKKERSETKQIAAAELVDEQITRMTDIRQRKGRPYLPKTSECAATACPPPKAGHSAP